MLKPSSTVRTRTGATLSASRRARRSCLASLSELQGAVRAPARTLASPVNKGDASTPSRTRTGDLLRERQAS
jgi:hypothetical protein